MSRYNEKFSDSKGIGNIAMLCVHSNPLGELGTRDTGGMSVYVRELARELGRLGVSVDIFTLCQDQPDFSIIFLSDNVRLISLNVRADQPVTKQNLFDYLPAVLRAYDRIVEKEKMRYDLIHSHYWLSGVLGNQIKQMRKLPHAATFHTIGAVKNRACRQEAEPDVRIAREKELTAACDRIIASTENEKHDLISLYNAAAEKIGVVPAGVDTELFRPRDKAAARRRLGLNDTEQLLLYVGRYVPVKGLDRLLYVMPAINNQHQGKNRFRLVVIGGDDENEKLKSMIRDLNIQKTVDLIGRMDHQLLPEYYSAADMLVVPSYHESFCLAGLEALACGTPVVSSPVGGMPQIINRKNGWLLTGKNDREMAEAIVQVADQQRNEGFRIKHIRESVQGYSWANTARNVLEEYSKIGVDREI